ncbi:MAG: SDR family oxidoreductase [Clostridiales Family XIII bacterium]|nr:SDR family oxidoreductase [Clostridiales Family XIII bacterium]
MSDRRLQGKSAIVTGSTSGIGRAIAELFAAEGAKVIVSGRREYRGEAVASGICEAGGTARYVQADMLVDGDMDNLVAQAQQTYGSIDILVNNAGTFLHRNFMDISLEDWEHYVRLDARSYFYMMQKVLPVMVGQGAGCIVNVTSNMGVMPAAGFAMYAFVKAGVTHLSRCVALEYADKGIRVNCLMPGATMTEMTQDQPDNDVIAGLVPMKRHSTAEEQAKAALFLASDDSSYMTGAPLIVDGGWYPY